MVRTRSARSGLKHQRRNAAMEHYAGLDVSVKETSVCVVDGAGQVVREVKVASEPGAILGVLADEAFTLKRIGLEAGPLSPWLYRALARTSISWSFDAKPATNAPTSAHTK